MATARRAACATAGTEAKLALPRSLEAAQTMRTVGFHNVYNIAHGFEGEFDAQHRRTL